MVEGVARPDRFTSGPRTRAPVLAKRSLGQVSFCLLCPSFFLEIAKARVSVTHHLAPLANGTGDSFKSSNMCMFSSAIGESFDDL